MIAETRRLSELKPHPLQQAIYGDVPEVELAALRVDIEQFGLRCPVEIALDGTIIDGCQRVRVFESLGRDEIPVIVRTELAEAEVTEAFIRANLVRRQLDPVARARAIEALAKLEHSRRGKRLDTRRNQEFREHLAEQLGNISGRSVDRYLALAKLPRAIQDAVSRADLPMTRALEIASLTPGQQQQVATRIAGGENARKVVNECLAPRRNATAPVEPAPKTPADEYRMLLDLLEASLADLAEHAADIVGAAMPRDRAVELLDRTIAFASTMRQLESEQTIVSRRRFPNVAFR